MINLNKNDSGFTAIELLVTLFIAAAFLVSGYQLYAVIIKDGNDAQKQAKASNFAYDYLQRYKASATNPCTAAVPMADTVVEVNGLSNVTATVSISCPFGTTSATSKIAVDIKYGVPQQTISNSTYTSKVCPKNFITVPGSVTYGTSNFCVMKYEAKFDSNDAYDISSPTGSPDIWNYQEWIMATAAPSVCDGCHLLTEAEWMTVAQNVLSVAANWSSGVVGQGYIFSGNNDTNPGTFQDASDNDSNGYYGTGNFAGDASITCSIPGNSQRRTLYLTNGEVIWDFAGNLMEWTAGQMIGSQPGVLSGGYAYREWNALPVTGSFVINPYPSGTGIPGASTWTAANGIGNIYSSADETGLKFMMRGGAVNFCGNAGVLYLDTHLGHNDAWGNLGYRAAQ